MKNIKILFVEDDAGIREELISFLSRYAKAGLYAAENAEEGLKLFYQHQPNIVISDIKMAKMSGIDMVKKIKETDPDQAVIFTTAHSDSIFFLEAIELQVAGYLLKPVDLRQLQRKIKKISQELILRRQYEAQKEIMNEIAHLQGSMLAVFDKNFQLLFLNDMALTFWGLKSTEEALEHNGMLGDRMVKGGGYFYPSDMKDRKWIGEIQDLEPQRRIIALRSLDGESIHAYMVDITYAKKTDHTIITLSEITKIEEERASYRKRMYIDDLTQIYNRAMFDKQIDNEVKKSLREGQGLSMILLDIDHFKQVNDHYGHLAGDQVLKGIGRLVKKSIRNHDFFARWGGEEFALLLPNTELEGAMKLAENLRKNIGSHRFPEGIFVSCSFGVASVREKGEKCLFRKADEALYEAKVQGRNRVVAYA